MTVASAFAADLAAPGARVRVLVFEDIDLALRIGVYDTEKRAPQRVRISAELLVVPAVPDPDDRIEQVLDYDAIFRAIGALAQAPHVELQETLAERVAALCLEPAEVAAVSVYVRKLDVYPNCASVGVRIVRRRPAASP